MIQLGASISIASAVAAADVGQQFLREYPQAVSWIGVGVGLAVVVLRLLTTQPIDGFE
jgi:hypothetical protein